MGITGFSNRNKQVFDEIRQKWVAATPEELVRQQWLKRMVLQLGYPKQLIVVEKQIEGLERRLDILCYGKSSCPSQPFFPLLLVECKAESMTEEAFNQLMGYNDRVGARFVAVIAREEVRFGVFDPRQGRRVFCSFLPSFKELIEWQS